MNFLFIKKSELNGNTACLTGDRARYATVVHNASIHQEYSVIVESAGITRGRVVTAEANLIELELETIKQAIVRPAINLIVGISRPPTVRKVIHSAVSFGVNKLCFLSSANSEKSYFSSKALLQDEMEAEVVLAQEQSGQVCPPEIVVARQFKKFVEDDFNDLAGSGRRLLCDCSYVSGISRLANELKNQTVTLVIGPESGWTVFEKQLLQQQACELVQLTEGMLRVELAVTAALAQVRGLQV